MPIYVYACPLCGVRYEAIERFDATAAAACRTAGCGGRAERVLTPPNIVFKGSGWYKTDSRPRSSEAS